MNKYRFILITFLLASLAAFLLFFGISRITPGRADLKMAAAGPKSTFMLPEIIQAGDQISLPDPVKKGTMSLEESLSLRRSIRQYTSDSLDARSLGQLLWAAQGINNERGFRTAPSAGATFPLEVFVLANRINGLPRGLYHYQPAAHSLLFVRAADLAADLARASLSQSMISDGAFVMIFAAVFERTTARYGERGIRYVHNEIGHASQNVHLQAAAMDLGTVVIGAYRDEEVEAILNLDPDLRVLYMMPVGRLP